ncbi:MAG: preprotein translocase subunit SecE [Oscillospiraceae bacterium]|nr:preprotein translocase subunit SecE [Oscillospiraceae bacterium]
MAKDLELEKSSPESEEAKDKLKKDDDKSKKNEKGAKAEKADKNDKDKKAAKVKKAKKGPIKYLKDAKSEFKKVVWPTPKETTRNTIVVVVVCLLAGLFVFGLDSLFGLLNNLLFK